MLLGVGGLTYAVLWVRYRPVVGFRVFACVCVTRLKLGILDYYPFLRYAPDNLAVNRVSEAMGQSWRRYLRSVLRTIDAHHRLCGPGGEIRDEQQARTGPHDNLQVEARAGRGCLGRGRTPVFMCPAWSRAF